jgi:ABC-type sugar transport system ATPase subunit
VGTAAVRFEDVSKRFPGVAALSNVSLEITAGTCHALCGENGAGKSTAAKIVAGIYAPDAGRLFIDEREVQFSNPRDAMAAGVGMVHQELSFCDNLTVAENLCLAALPRSKGFLNQQEMRERARAMLAEVGASLDVDRRLGDLTIAQQQLVQIAVAVGGGARIIIFDEPTSSLSEADADRLYETIGRLKARGVTCIYVSHRMPEIYRLCDRISVLRDGRHVATRETASLSESELVEMMIGRPLAEYFPSHVDRPPGDEMLRVEHLSCPGKFHDISFSVRAGEIVGLAGLVGAGRSEVATALIGLQQNVTGDVYLRGQRVVVRNPRHGIELGIGLVPEDRKRQGLVLSESTLHNFSLPILPRLSRLSWLDQVRERRTANDYLTRLMVRSSALDVSSASLSGGNQQKVVLAKWLAAQTRLLALDEPTRGVDVGAKAEIHGIIDKLAAEGHAILLISSELPEIITLATRILVMREGRVVGEVARNDATQARLMRMMAGADDATYSVAR